MSAQTQTVDELHGYLAQLVAPAADPVARDVAHLVRRVDALRAALGRDAPPMLRHYLDRRSYAKALDLLEGRDGTTKPAC
jgi:hypothetical protein